jgi:hypothetical protein
MATSKLEMGQALLAKRKVAFREFVMGCMEAGATRGSANL